MIVDLHNHLIPGVDDGARDADETRAALLAFRDEGVRHVVATPHIDASLAHTPEILRRRLDELAAGFERLREIAAAACPDVAVQRGAEVMLDTPEPDFSDPGLRLAGGRFVLIEFPQLMIPPNTVPVLERIANAAWTPVIAHPERYGGVEQRLGLVEEWRATGAVLQANSASLAGWYGPAPRAALLLLLERGWIDLLASDYHARGRPFVRRAFEALRALEAEEQAQMLLETNPARLVAGERLLPVLPLRRRLTLLQRLAKLASGRSFA